MSEAADVYRSLVEEADEVEADLENPDTPQEDLPGLQLRLRELAIEVEQAKRAMREAEAEVFELVGLPGSPLRAHEPRPFLRCGVCDAPYAKPGRCPNPACAQYDELRLDALTREEAIALVAWLGRPR